MSGLFFGGLTQRLTNPFDSVEIEHTAFQHCIVCQQLLACFSTYPLSEARIRNDILMEMK
jgi:hypothetical protein